jgi:hypothetical protein
MKRWNDQIDPASIPDSVILAERARRNSAKRITPSGGRNGGRPVKLALCPRGCGFQSGVVEMRKHKCEVR